MEAFKDAIMAYAAHYPVVEILSAIAVAAIISLRRPSDDNITTHRYLYDLYIFVALALVPTVTTIGILVVSCNTQRFFSAHSGSFSEQHPARSDGVKSERIFKLLDTPVDIESPAVTKKPQGPGRIEFDHVWFSYDVRGTAADTLSKSGGKGGSSIQGEASPGAADPDWVLRDVSFSIEPGETVAIVGHTGAGKTTLISLLLRFYDVQEGAIRIDGVDLKEMDLNDLRRRFGVVLQDPFLFSGTVGGNIRLGSDWIADKDVEKAAEEVNLADFIRTLPGGFGEEVRERGSTLSTGQKQLISFARALAHNPQILILDEATSSVDTETEFKVRDALSRMVEGRTSLVIAHRLSTVQRADKIIVMHKGKVREMGTHQQLLAQRGVYYKLYQLQYKDQEISAALAAQPQPTVSADD